MIRLITISSVLFLFISTHYAQWTNQNPVPDGNNLFSTFFIDDNTGWIVGSNGFIKKTSDTGLEWIQQNSGTSLTLRSVQFVNENTGWICGENGLILKTSDGGQNWITIPSGNNELLTDLYFCDLYTGYVVGSKGTILKTVDGGLNWTSQTSWITNNLYSIDFVDKFVGYVVGDGHIFLKTTDGGSNWSSKVLALNGNPNLNCVEFTDINSGWIGYGFDKYTSNLIRTTDGGDTWTITAFSPISKPQNNIHIEADNPLDNQVGIRSIYFKDSENGYAVGGTADGWNRCIYTTSNGGASWQNKYIYSEQTGLLSVIVNDNGVGWAVGYSGVIYKTNNNGSVWHQILSGNNNLYYSGDWITSIFMINENVGWAAGYRKGIWYYPILLKTTDGGKIWETNYEFNDYFIGTPANIFFLNENVGWVSFYDRGSYKTTDGGESWSLSGNAGNQKFFINQDTGWEAYEPLGVFKSTDGGTNWTQKSSVNSRSIYFSDLNNGWAVGSGGSILKSTDEGENWNVQASGTSTDLNSVNFFDKKIGMCVGNSGTSLLTTNGGIDWITQNPGTAAKLNAVVLISENTIWVAGANGTILNSTDLGNSWTSYNELTGNNLNSVYFISVNTGWVAGSNGTILKYHEDVLPVELQSFNAEIKNGNVELSWQTATEINNLGFQIERKIIEGDWNNIGFVDGQGNSVSPKSYIFIDEKLTGGSIYKYRLKQIDIDGNYKYSDEIEVEFAPEKFALYQNYPNPFNPSTKIRYQLAAESNVTILIYDILGNKISTLVDEKKQPGIYDVEFDGSNLASGTYIYRILADNFVETKKMMLLK